MTKVRAIVLNYNGDPHVYRSVAALLDTQWPVGDLEVVVVDNASTDGSDAVLQRSFPSVVLRRQRANTGFPANNVALADLTAVDYVALVNNDAFVTPGWLAPLVETMETDPTLGAVCPKLLFAPQFVDLGIDSKTHRVAHDNRALGVRISGLRVEGADRWRAAQFPRPGCWGVEAGGEAEPRYTWTNGQGVVRVPVEPAVGQARGVVEVRLAAERPTAVVISCGSEQVEVTVGPVHAWFALTLSGRPYDVVQNAGSLLLTGGYGADRGFLEVDAGQYGVGADVFAWCGGGVLLRPDYLRDVGLFDERFFAYYEDTDLSWRGRARSWRYRYVPESVIRHQHATTSVEGSDLFHRYVERNRLLMLTKNAPGPLVLRALVHYVAVTASYARRDVVGPLRRGRRPRPGIVLRRLRSFAAYGRLLPVAWVQRRRARRRQLVPDDVLAAEFTPREVFEQRSHWGAVVPVGHVAASVEEHGIAAGIEEVAHDGDGVTESERHRG